MSKPVLGHYKFDAYPVNTQGYVTVVNSHRENIEPCNCCGGPRIKWVNTYHIEPFRIDYMRYEGGVHYIQLNRDEKKWTAPEHFFLTKKEAQIEIDKRIVKDKK